MSLQLRTNVSVGVLVCCICMQAVCVRTCVCVCVRACVCVQEREMGEWTWCTQAQFSWAASKCGSRLAATYYGDTSDPIAPVLYPRPNLIYPCDLAITPNPLTHAGTDTPQKSLISSLVPLTFHSCPPIRPCTPNLTWVLSWFFGSPLIVSVQQPHPHHHSSTYNASSLSPSLSSLPPYLSLVLWKLCGVEILVMWGDCCVLCQACRLAPLA